MDHDGPSRAGLGRFIRAGAVLSILITGAALARAQFGKKRKREGAMTDPTQGGSSTDGGRPHPETPTATVSDLQQLVGDGSTTDGGRPHPEGDSPD